MTNEKIYCGGCGKELNPNEVYGLSATQQEPDYINGITIHKEADTEYFCKRCYVEINGSPEQALILAQLEEKDKQLEETKQELKEAKSVLHDLGYDDERIKGLYCLRHGENK